MDKKIISERLQDLRNEFSAGQNQLKHFNRHIVDLEKTLLRISGAIQVLEEVQVTETESVRAD